MAPTDVSPLGNQLLVKPFTAQDNLQGGLVTPDNVVQDRSDTGEVISKGEEATLAPGTKIIFNKYAAEEIFLGDVKHLLVSQDDVMAIYR